MKTPTRMLVSNISGHRRDLRPVRNTLPDLRLLRLVTLAAVGRLRTFCGLIADRRRLRLLDHLADLLPSLLLLGFLVATSHPFVVTFDYMAWLR